MSTRFQELHMDQLVLHPKNIRRDVGNVVELANSISEQGILQPLVVAPQLGSTDGEQFVIIAGHRRHAAAKLVNVDVLPCVIRDDIDTDSRQIVAMLVENTQRADLTPTEEAAGYQTVMDFGEHNVKAMAKATGRSQGFVRKRLLLNRLSDEAKGKLEDHTLNVDQALVLVDFADNEDATATLLNAAANGRDWNHAVHAEVRKRDAPVKVEAFERELEELDATFLPDKDRYMGKWNRIYENDTNAITIAEHITAGHQVIIDRHWGKLEWYEKTAAAAKAKKAALTDEEIEAKRRDAALAAALEIAHAVRAEHLKATVLAPAPDAPRKALLDLITEHIHLYTATIAEITGRPANREDGNADLKEALATLNLEQLAMLYHLLRNSQEPELLKLWAWDAGDYRHRYGPKGWLETLQGLYGYQLSSVEQEVLDHFAALADTQPTSTDEDDDQEEDEDA